MKSKWVFWILSLGMFLFTSLQGQTRLFHLGGRA